MTDPTRELRPSGVVRKHENRRWYRFAAALGVGIILLELAVSYASGDKMNGMRLLVAAIIGFVGFYGLDPKDMRESGTLIYTWASGILTIIRTGKRDKDATGTTVVTTVDTNVSPPKETTVVVPPGGHKAEEDLSRD